MSVLVPVTFRFPTMLVPNAQRVAVIGTFNDWNPAAHPLRRAGDFWWIITVPLPPGRVVYCFDVDGATWQDPNHTGTRPHGPNLARSARDVITLG